MVEPLLGTIIAMSPKGAIQRAAREIPSPWTFIMVAVLERGKVARREPYGNALKTRADDK